MDEIEQANGERRISPRAFDTIWDVVVIGAGLNGLVAATYLARAGCKVAVLEKREVVGGTAVTEEVIPGYKFSRAWDVIGLLRPRIAADLELERRGIHIYGRNPHVLTPLSDGSRYLMLGRDVSFNSEQIRKFSERDAHKFEEFNLKMKRLADAVAPLMDLPPIQLFPESTHDSLGIWDRLEVAVNSARFAARLARLGKDTAYLYEMFTSPLARVLNREFESEPLRTQIARSSIIGSMTGPLQPGTGSLLLRHMLGSVDGAHGLWSYVRGGMGALSSAIADAAQESGAEIILSSPASRINVDQGRAVGVELEGGGHLKARRVVSALDPWNTFINMCPQQELPERFLSDVRSLNFRSGVFKLNVALDKLPTLRAIPRKGGEAGPEHHCTIYMGAETMDQLDAAYFDAEFNKRPSSRPLISMTIPSVMDPSLAPPGHAVCGIVVQHAAFDLPWNEPSYKDQFVRKIFSTIDNYMVDFSKHVVGYDALSPVDLQEEFGAHMGNLFHGAMTLDQMYFLRPVRGFARYRSPLKNLYICGSGTHPGAGVSGASGRNCADIMLRDGIGNG